MKIPCSAALPTILSSSVALLIIVIGSRNVKLTFETMIESERGVFGDLFVSFPDSSIPISDFLVLSASRQIGNNNYCLHCNANIEY